MTTEHFDNHVARAVDILTKQACRPVPAKFAARARRPISAERIDQMMPRHMVIDGDERPRVAMVADALGRLQKKEATL